MIDNLTIKPPKWYWAVSIIAFIWNLMGVIAYLGQVYMTEEDLRALPEAERSLYMDVPAWVTGAFALAVFGGAFGCLGLILKKQWSKPLLILSLIAVIAQMSYNLFMSRASEVYGPGGMIMPIMVIILSALLVWFAYYATKNHWIS